MSLLEQKIAVLDGAMGTMLQQAGLTPADFGGARYEGCNELLNLTRPDVVLRIHEAYLQAGADIIETNSFGATRIVLDEYGLGDRVAELNLAAAQLARTAAERHASPGRPRFVAGSMGPTHKAISVTGGVTFPELRHAYREQAEALILGGVDLLLVETCQDTRNVKAALLGIRDAFERCGVKLPVAVSGTIEPTGTMLAGQSIDAFWVSISHVELIAVGLNCATGPDLMTDHLRTLHEMAWTRVLCYPNAGLPDAEGRYLATPESFAGQLERFVRSGWLNLVGGCCGTTPAHIRALAQMVEGKKPRVVPERSRKTLFSGLEVVGAEESNRPLIVGERTNVVGSRRFRQLIAEQKWDEASEIARQQVRNGAHIIDVCLASSERDEIRDVPPFYEALARKVKVPVMIDSTDPVAIELALSFCQGKCIINSINLEEGEERFRRVCPLARAYGAAVVVGVIDEDPVQAQAFTRERKLEVAERAYELLTTKYAIPPEDIIFDALVFPCASGDENYIGGAVETVEAARLFKARFPHSKTILGISNVSFGLPPAAREVVNSVFLYHATKAGLDLAIVDAGRLQRYASIPEAERELAERLLFNWPPPEGPEELRDAPRDWRQQPGSVRVAIHQYNIAEITEHFRKKTVQARHGPSQELSVDERLSRCVIEGSREGLFESLDRKLGEGSSPLDIINGPLMKGMEEVGRLFNNNELIVAEVLQSAEVMKAAVSYLEKFMPRTETAMRGKVVLATVKGDVHDIGKNLVQIIFSNNGYQVIDLGIKVPPEAIIASYQEHKPDAIGLSGLLVKSAHQMVVTAEDLRAAGIRVPLLVGGAALSDRFTRTKIAPAYGEAVIYAKDAMTGLKLLNQLMDPARRETVLEAHRPRPVSQADESGRDASAAQGFPRSRRIRTDVSIPELPYPERRVLETEQLGEIWSYLNPQMLYGKHLGFRGPFEKLLAERDSKALELFHMVEEIKEWAASFMRVRAVWRFFHAERSGNAIALFDPANGELLASFTFPRQAGPEGLCLADFVLDPQEGRRDQIAIFVVTAGAGIRERADEALREGQYFRSHALQALALETAEAAAEWLHRRLREDWGFPDPPGMSMKERFQARYRGKRYSLGYPACPDLAQQALIWKLLSPEEIGVHLTEGFMMDPEASVSALVFHHPDCIYFNAGEPST